MDLTFNNGRVEIWVYSEHKQLFGVTVKNKGLMYKFNTVTNKYAKDAKFSANDEPYFVCSIRQLEQVAVDSPQIKRILTQLFAPTLRVG